MFNLGLPYWEHIALVLDIISIFLGIIAFSAVFLAITAKSRNNLLKDRQKKS